MNKIIITGNIAREPEARTTQTGLSVCSFTVAVQRSVKNANGTYDADFLPVVAWRQTADFVSRYLHKGSKVAVEGSVQTRSYDAQDGSKRYVTEIIADRVEGMEPRNSNGGNRPAPQAPQGADEFTETEDDDLPF